jgi:vacuolar-type H+-ATPase subunit H
MIDTISPLQAINKKELDLRQRVEEAHRQAEAQIQAARKAAKEITAQADEEGRAKAEAIFQQGVEEARQQADAIVATAYEEAATLRSQALARLVEVAERIVQLVLPGERSGGF